MIRIPRLFLLVQLMICVVGAFGCGGDDDKNECAEEKEIRMQAIQSKCSETNLYGCCYCSCELTGAPAPDDPNCSCANWQLTTNVSTATCEGGALQNAATCIGNVAGCESTMKTIVQNRCSTN